MSSAFELVLHNTWEASEREPPNDDRRGLLNFILIISTHKTYKYILINGLLGASAAWKNPLVLQAQSDLERAWDARSVCHGVLVPFEREHMEGRLGSSNEPFLNKPARFPELARTNAVRRGRDKQVLDAMIELFNSIRDQSDAQKLLTIALHLVRKLPTQKLNVTLSKGVLLLPKQTRSLLRQNIEGEVLTFVTGLVAFSIFDPKKFRIGLHPLNQSGASSKEIADIDVWLSQTGKVISCFEIKDKDFSAYDFEHARDKCYGAGVESFLFVSRNSWIRRFMKNEPIKFKAYNKQIVSIESLMRTFDFSFLNLGEEGFQVYTDDFMKGVRPKPETVKIISQTFM